MSKENGTIPAKYKFLLDFAPIAAFFAAYYLYDIMVATAVIMVASLVQFAVLYKFNGKPEKSVLIATIGIIVFGGMTLILDDPLFIKIRPTIANFLFAGLLLLDIFLLKKYWLRMMMGSQIEMNEDAWRIFSLRWAGFFVFLAVMNEIIWRFMSEEFWVNYKLFGVMFLFFAFFMSQAPFLMKHNQKPMGK